jgi:hypothetical protein
MRYVSALNVVILYLYLETVDVAYVARVVTPHKVCVYKELYTGSDQKYWWYVPSLRYKCPPYVRHITGA